MPENDDEDIVLGETSGDLEVSLPADNLYIVVSRIKHGDNYTTKLWLSRKVRRFYAIGLLTEGLAMLSNATEEFTYCEDTPGCFPGEDSVPQDDDGDDDDEQGSGVPVG